jgi:hypothetical protein
MCLVSAVSDASLRSRLGINVTGSGLHIEHLVALHGFIKKTRTTPDEDLALARKRKKDLEQ